MEIPEDLTVQKKLNIVFLLVTSIAFLLFFYTAIFGKFYFGMTEFLISLGFVCFAYLTKRGKKWAYNVLRAVLWLAWVGTGCLFGILIVMLISAKYELLNMRNDPDLPLNVEAISRLFLATIIVYFVVFSASLYSYVSLTRKSITKYFRKE